MNLQPSYIKKIENFMFHINFFKSKYDVYLIVSEDKDGYSYSYCNLEDFNNLEKKYKEGFKFKGFLMSINARLSKIFITTTNAEKYFDLIYDQVCDWKNNVMYKNKYITHYKTLCEKIKKEEQNKDTIREDFNRQDTNQEVSDQEQVENQIAGQTATQTLRFV